MSDIKAGDLIMCVKPSLCCGVSKGIGKTATVTAVESATVICSDCGHEQFLENAIFGERPDGRQGYVERSRVIKISPPAMPESITNDEELTA